MKREGGHTWAPGAGKALGFPSVSTLPLRMLVGTTLVRSNTSTTAVGAAGPPATHAAGNRVRAGQQQKQEQEQRWQQRRSRVGPSLLLSTQHSPPTTQCATTVTVKNGGAAREQGEQEFLGPHNRLPRYDHNHMRGGGGTGAGREPAGHQRQGIPTACWHAPFFLGASAKQEVWKEDEDATAAAHTRGIALDSMGRTATPSISKQRTGKCSAWEVGSQERVPP
jgi:hypothetical protein